MKKLICLSLMCLSFTTHAKLLHIIHMNDLHSYFEGYKEEGIGGYARMKAKLDELKAESEKKGIPTLVLDGGDFGEGTSFFLADDAAYTIRALDVFGVEASVVGNHDYMLGGNYLSKQIKKANAKTKILSANIIQTPDMELGDLVKPYADFEKGGLKIRVIGLSTAEPHFQYAISPGWVNDPILFGQIEGKKAKEAGKDLVIALTHIGTMFDKLLAQNTSDIDLIVGGHDHKRLDQPVLEKNKDKKAVPIVQAESHSMLLGSMLIDVQPGNKVTVVEYKMHEIKADMPEDPTMAQLVEEARFDRNVLFGGRFDEPVGFTEIKLSGYEKGHMVAQKTCWGEHMARIVQEATGADMGIHMAFFEGMKVEPGVVTFGDLIDNFPHISHPNDLGWEVATFDIPGKNLKILLRAIATMKTQMGFSIWPVDFNFVRMPENLPWIGDLSYAWSFKIAGKKIEKNKTYKVAFPAEIVHAVKVSLPKKAAEIFPNTQMSGKFMWPLMEAYVKKNSPIRCLNRPWKK